MESQSKLKSVALMVVGGLLVALKSFDGAAAGCARRVASGGADAASSASRVVHEADLGAQAARAGAEVADAEARAARAGAEVAEVESSLARSSGGLAAGARTGRRGRSLRTAVRWAQTASNIDTGVELVEKLSDYLTDEEGHFRIPPEVADAPATVLCVLEAAHDAIQIHVAAPGQKPVRVTVASAALSAPDPLAQALREGLQQGNPALAVACDGAKRILLQSPKGAPDLAAFIHGRPVVQLPPVPGL